MQDYVLDIAARWQGTLESLICTRHTNMKLHVYVCAIIVHSNQDNIIRK